MKVAIKFVCGVICSAVLLLQACSPAATSQNDSVEVVERTRPVEAPWRVTPTPNLSLTATVTARESAITTYPYYESFNQNTYDWRVGEEDNDYWQGSINIQDGMYTWQFTAVKSTFMSWAIFKEVPDVQDFDLALRARRVAGEPQLACFGVFYRISPDGIDGGAYMLTVCDNGFYKMLYYDAENRWDTIQDWTETRAIVSDDWNLIEVSAREADFSILINHQQVLTFSDTRLTRGQIAILIDHYSENPGQIAFDFFALQPQ
jgi:hypothetical protein